MIERIAFNGWHEDPNSMFRKLTIEIDDLDRLTFSIHEQNGKYKAIQIDSAFDVFDELGKMIGEG